MKIIRDGKEYELTTEEILQAHQEFVISFMQDILERDFDIPEKRSKSLAKLAYDHYAEGHGETEYECIEWAAERDPGEKFYFTFGTDPGFPYCGGYLIIIAKNLKEACENFSQLYPDRHKNTLNCAFVYSEEKWGKIPEYMGRCHRVIKI